MIKYLSLDIRVIKFEKSIKYDKIKYLNTHYRKLLLYIVFNIFIQSINQVVLFIFFDFLKELS